MARVAPRAVPLMDHELVSSTRTAPGTVLLEPVSPSMPPSPPILLAAVERLRACALALERERATELERAAPHAREGVCNLLHYLAVRRHDLRPLQRELGRLGLSSLGRMESRVMATLDAVARALGALAGRRTAVIEPDPRFELGESRLAANAVQVFGPEPHARATRVMVTLPSEAADAPGLIHDLLEAGADLVRVNAAHDDAQAWTKMVGYVRAAEAALDRGCRVSFDLAGPKLRTGTLEPGHAVLKLRPERDALGRVIAPARVRLVPAQRVPPAAPDVVPVDSRLLHRVKLGDVFEMVDARGRTRRLTVVGFDPDARPVCETDRTVYLVPGTVLVHRRGKRSAAEGEVGALRPMPGEIPLKPGDRLDLVYGRQPGHACRLNLDGRPLEPASVSCEVRAVFDQIQPGHRVLFDDGTIGAVVKSVERDRVVLEIVRCADGTAKLREEKGINLPDTLLELSAITEDDLQDLAFAVEHVDLVSASFVQRPEDVIALRDALASHGASRIGIVLKIETAHAFARLPELLMAAAAHPGGAAVMVARGDLAVEIGFERLAEVQEEILWLCEAAHVPVIWATQVLEGLARGGVPSRAEVTDAAMSGRAECVMLNKGPRIVETVAFLSDVLVRMSSHQAKKTPMMRALSVSGMDGGRRC